MPYIKQEDRDKIKRTLDNPDQHVYDLTLTSGELNYLITKLCHNYIARNGVNYFTMNEVIGVLECAKLELYRRVLSPYEDIKIKENGDL